MFKDRRAFAGFFAGATLATALVSTFSVAQDTVSPPVYGGVNFRVRGVFVTPVAGSPFTATALIESSRPLPDGTVETQRTINKIARDSQGRIHNERRRLMPDSYKGTPALLETHLFDPQTRLNTFFEPYSRVARQSILPSLPRNPALATQNGVGTVVRSPWVKEEGLGSTTLNGLTAKGLRRTRTIDAKISGTGKPVEVVDEYWYSEDLHLNLLVHHTDPRSGEQTVAISDIQRADPPAAMFEVPAGFKTVDVTPPAEEK